MKAKDYLEQIRILDRLINNKLQELEQLEALATKVTSVNSGDRVQTSGSQDKMADTVIKILELKQEINADIDRLVDLKVDAIRIIKKVKNKQHQKILYQKYIQYNSLYSIAQKRKVDYGKIKRIHRKALEKFEEILHIVV